jgi:regulator of protease activity HflC (stomatin/prohibitin superfamily)
MTIARGANFSRIKEVATAWEGIQQMIRSGDKGYLVPVVIPRDRRGFGWLGLMAFALYLLGAALAATSLFITVPLILLSMLLGLISLAWFWRQAVVSIEQGTTGILSRYGAIVGTLGPGRHFLWWPWVKIDSIVDTSTEFPYTAPVLASPTRESIPLKSIEFFLKFRIEDPIRFVRNIGASNFDVVLSNVVQDAIRRRSRQVQTERAYDLRSSDVGDMQDYLNQRMEPYGVRITGANIPDVQLPDQYQENLATRERVAKEQNAYEKEWELTRRQRIDTLLMETERAKKERDARIVEARSAVNKAREDIAQMLQEQELQAEKIRWDIEARGRSTLNAAENEAKGLQHLGLTYRDNRALWQYQLAQRRLQVAEKLVLNAPRPLLVNTNNQDTSALSTLLIAQLLPGIIEGDGKADK